MSRFGHAAACAVVAAALGSCTYGGLDALKAGPDAGRSHDAGSGTDTGVCKADHADCNVNPSDGCETNLLTSLTDCGGCGSLCSLPHAMPECVNGTCSLAACDSGFADCDHDVFNGCEINLQADPNNCGSCGHACSTVGGSAVCVAGVCGTSPCSPGTGDCDADPAHDCEAVLASDPLNCGYCGHQCSFSNATAECQGGNCVLGACSAGHANCDNKPGNGCEATLASDGKNCGACGHDCLGGACSGGKCQPITVAGGLGDPTGIAVDATNVYVTAETNGKLYQIPKAGGAALVLASGQPSPFGVAADSSFVYFTNRVDTGGTICRVPIGGGSVQLLVNGQARPSSIAVDSNYVYWTNAIAASMLRAPLAGGTATVLVSNIGGILGLAIDSSRAYYSTDSTTQGEVGSIPLGGGSKTVFGTGLADPRTLVEFGTHLYWVNFASGTVQTVLKTGGTPLTVASGATNPEAVTADGSYVYFGDHTNPGSIYRAPVSGGNADTMASDQARPRRMAEDTAAVYWTNDEGGQVMKLAK